MIQKVKWKCLHCDWEKDIEYEPTPDNLTEMLGSLRGFHEADSPDCEWKTDRIMVYHPI